MSAGTKIEWTDATWNPIRGCSRVSEGCRNCYAERQAARFSGKGQAYEGLVRIANGHPQWTGKVEFVERHLMDPLRWKEPKRIFVNSMSDLFHEGVSNDWLQRIFQVMAKAQQHVFQVLTKRPERMRSYMHDWRPVERVFPNVWLGVSVEDQKTADERIPLLLQTPAALRWVSAEPLLGDIQLPEEAFVCPANEPHQICPCLDWVVVGGESGPGARPMDIEWARSIVAQCEERSVSVFVKQLGRNPYITVGENSVKLRDPKGGDWSEWPQDLRIREYPEGNYATT